VGILTRSGNLLNLTSLSFTCPSGRVLSHLRLRISTQRASAEARDPVRMRETNNIALQVAPIHAARKGKHHPDRQHALNGVP
jgi:hypothetical protein